MPVSGTISKVARWNWKKPKRQQGDIVHQQAGVQGQTGIRLHTGRVCSGRRPPSLCTSLQTGTSGWHRQLSIGLVLCDCLLAVVTASAVGVKGDR